MKFYTVISAYLFLCVLYICQVLAHHEQVNTENASTEAGVYIGETNVNRVLHNYMMAVCNKIQPGSMRNMNMAETLNIPSKLINSILMMPNVMRRFNQNLNARSIDDDAVPA